MMKSSSFLTIAKRTTIIATTHQVKRQLALNSHQNILKNIFFRARLQQALYEWKDWFILLRIHTVVTLFLTDVLYFRTFFFFFDLVLLLVMRERMWEKINLSTKVSLKEDTWNLNEQIRVHFKFAFLWVGWLAK